MDIIPIDANALDQHKKMLVEHMDGYDIAYNAVPMHKVDDLPTLSLNTLRDEIYQDAVAHGLWEEDETQYYTWPDECHSLIEEEVDELYDTIEDWENGHGNERYTEELADVVIMCFSVAGKLGIDIDAAIRRKMEINKGRPWKHGKNE